MEEKMADTTTTKTTANSNSKIRMQVMVDPWEEKMIRKIAENEGRNISDVLRILAEIGMFTLLENQNEVERRLRRIRGTDKNTLLVYLQSTEN